MQQLLLRFLWGCPGDTLKAKSLIIPPDDPGESHFWFTGLDQSLAQCFCGSENRGALSWAKWQGLIPASALCAILGCSSCLVLTWHDSLSYHLQLYRGPSTFLTSSRSCYWRGSWNRATVPPMLSVRQVSAVGTAVWVWLRDLIRSLETAW